MSNGHGLAKVLMIQMSQQNVARDTPLSGEKLAEMAYEGAEAFRALRDKKRDQYKEEAEQKALEAELKAAEEKASEVRKQMSEGKSDPQ